MPQQTNILFLLSDQHNPRIAGYEGDPYIQTPSLDQLAASGTRLNNCYCASPLCVPSRAALLSGRYPDATGVFSNNQSLHSDVPTLAHALTVAGYESVLCGRMHFVGPDQRHGFARRLVGDFTAANLGMTNANCGQTWAGTTGQHRNVIKRSGPGHSGVMEYDRAVTGAACDFIRTAQENRPWFMTVGWYGPHCTYCCPRTLFDKYMDLLPLPDCPEDFKANCHPAVRNWMLKRDVLAAVDTDAIRRARAAYYGLVELLDQHVGAILKTLSDCGLTEQTLVVYSSDHGDCLGHNGLWWKSNFYEGSVRVPCLFAKPGFVQSGKELTVPSSLLDLTPTLIEIAGANPLPCPDGISLSNPLQGGPENPDRAVLSMLGDIKGDHPSAMIRRGAWKLVDHAAYALPQLFNLEMDPDEQLDLGADAHYADIRDSLFMALRQRWDPASVNRQLADATANAEIIHHWNQVVQPSDEGDFWHCPPDCNILDT